jgi:hypothetical protein
LTTKRITVYLLKGQDKLTKAYYELREKYAQLKFVITPNELTTIELKIVREAYLLLVAEAQVQ